MRIPRFYYDHDLATGVTLTLNEKASRYLVSVLRMQPGRPCIVFNGQGGEYAAILTHAGKKQAEVLLGEFNDINNESPLKIHLGIAISRGDRMDWVVQKATELGVHRITPLFTERTEVKLKGERLDKKLEHWQQIAISACEQSQRNQLPTIDMPTTFSEWVSSVEADRKLVLHHRTEQRLQSETGVDSCCLLIGPEGGLSETEIELALSENFQALSLGPRVLRTETAPISALTLVQFLWGDM